MYFQQFLNQLHGCASYLVASRQSGEAAVIDPASETEQYTEVLRLRGLRLRYVIDTHIHADHLSGARQLASAQGAELCLHALARTDYHFRSLADGEELELGPVRMRICHTPGHRPELITMLLANLARSTEPSIALTADCLLAGDVGRPDFGGGDAATQFASIQRLLGLPDWMSVFPGHFEGPCGKSMSGEPSTTIGYERRYNRLTRLACDQFVSAITTDAPARPLNMVAIEATNRGTVNMSWAMLTSRARVAEVDADRLEAPPRGAILVDVREPQEYAAGHMPGAINVPQAELASRLDELPRDRALFLTCRTGSRSRRAAQFLTQMDYVHVTNVHGGIEAWRAAGRPLV
jgi:hydroxyacylglutathione hydrolase